MKIAITGSTGRVGKNLVKFAQENNHDVITWTKDKLNLETPSTVEDLVQNDAPDVVIHAAAETGVDFCTLFPETAVKLNGEATKIISKACADRDIKFIYISTNEVFDGESLTGYGPWDSPNPINSYGKSKLAGELGCNESYERKLDSLTIVRTSWVFGSGYDFIDKIISHAKSYKEQNQIVRLVNDEMGCPTSASDLARVIIEELLSERGKHVNIVNSGITSRAEYGKTVLQLANIEVNIQEITSDSYVRPSKVPKRAILNSSYPLRDWKEALEENMRERGLCE